MTKVQLIDETFLYFIILLFAKESTVNHCQPMSWQHSNMIVEHLYELRSCVAMLLRYQNNLGEAV